MSRPDCWPPWWRSGCAIRTDPGFSQVEASDHALGAVFQAGGDRHAGPGALSRLTPLELRVLREIALGSSNRAVAVNLALFPRAVEKHINAIFAKLSLVGHPSVDHHVKAALLLLSELHGGNPPTGRVSTPTRDDPPPPRTIRATP
jgi:DNA-binding CsgD family transcriptional regulator